MIEIGTDQMESILMRKVVQPILKHYKKVLETKADVGLAYDGDGDHYDGGSLG